MQPNYQKIILKERQLLEHLIGKILLFFIIFIFLFCLLKGWLLNLLQVMIMGKEWTFGVWE